MLWVAVKLHNGVLMMSEIALSFLILPPPPPSPSPRGLSMDSGEKQKNFYAQKIMRKKLKLAEKKRPKIKFVSIL